MDRDHSRPRTAVLSAIGIFGLGAIGISSMLPTVGQAHDELPAHHVNLPETATPAMRAFWGDRLLKDNLSDATNALDNAPAASCTGGTAAPAGHEVTYGCDGIDLQSFLSLNSIGGTRQNSAANDIWGWTAPDGSEYAIIGRTFGTSFIDISDPNEPVYLGELPTHGAFGSSWRDIKVRADHAYIVSEALNHGMQVFDLGQLETMSRTNLPVTFNETAHYNKVGSAHNIAINEDSGFAYAVGASGKNGCSGGLHMIDISNPASPSFAGCFAADGYTHDVQCVTYAGLDPDHQGTEICLAANEDTVTIVDVTDKANPVQLSRTTYQGSAYTHQGWLTPDHAWFVVDDELDEQTFVHGTRTRYFDVTDLDNPVLGADYTSESTAIDHNLYMVGGCAMQANYQSGLRVLRSIDGQGLFDPGSAALRGWFDIYPTGDTADFNGAWSNYPYFPSGNIIVSGIEQGLYVLKPQFDATTECALNSPTGNTPPTVTITAPTETTFTLGDTITFEATATDNEDATSPDLSWTAGSESIGTGTTISWTPQAAGDYIVVASATDADDATGSDSIAVTVNPDAGSAIYVSSLAGIALPGNGRRWTAQVAIEISSANGAVPNATVAGSWSGGAKGSASCTTGANGLCTVSKSAKTGTTVIFTVTSVTHPTLAYDPGANLETSEIISGP